MDNNMSEAFCKLARIQILRRLAIVCGNPTVCWGIDIKEQSVCGEMLADWGGWSEAYNGR